MKIKPLLWASDPSSKEEWPARGCLSFPQINQLPHWTMGTTKICGKIKFWCLPKYILLFLLPWLLIPLVPPECFCSTQLLKACLRPHSCLLPLLTCSDTWSWPQSLSVPHGTNLVVPNTECVPHWTQTGPSSGGTALYLICAVFYWALACFTSQSDFFIWKIKIFFPQKYIFSA